MIPGLGIDIAGDSVFRALRYEAKLGLPERGVIVTTATTEAGIIVRVSTKRSKVRAFADVKTENVLADYCFNKADGHCRFRIGREKGPGAAIDPRILDVVFRDEGLKSLLPKGFSITLVAYRADYGVLLSSLQGRPGDWMLVTVSKDFKTVKKNPGY